MDLSPGAALESPEQVALLLRMMRFGLLGITLVLLILFIFITISGIRLVEKVGEPRAAELPPGISWESSIYGWGNNEIQQLIGPSDVAVASDGTIWVCDPQRWQVLGFWPDGTYRQIIHKGPGKMMPQVIAIGPEGEIYVGDTLNNEVRVFNSDNVMLRSWPTSMPTEIAVSGRMVVVGTVDGIVVFDKGGAKVAQWHGRGAAEDQFDVVRGLAIDSSGTIYLSDTHNQRLKAYSVERGMLWCYPSGSARRTASADTTAPGAGLYQLPVGMTMDGRGRLLVADAFLFRIDVVDPKNGKLVGSHGAYGTEDGRFLYPASLAYDRSLDRVIVADTGNNRIQILRVSGTGGNPLIPLRKMVMGPIRRVVVPAGTLMLVTLIFAWTRELVLFLRHRAKPAGDGRPLSETA